MSMGFESREAAPRHPFVAALASNDHPALVDTLAADVVLHPPVVLTTFDGRETVGELYAADMSRSRSLRLLRSSGAVTPPPSSGGDEWRDASSRALTGSGLIAPARSARSRSSAGPSPVSRAS